MFIINTDKLNKKIFLENLPKNNNKIDWVETSKIKPIVDFIYGEIKGEIQIIDIINNTNKKIKVKYKGEEFIIYLSGFVKCNLGSILGIKTSNFKIEIGSVFKDSKRDIIVIDRMKMKNKHGQLCKYYKYHCNRCGFECGEHYKSGKYKEENWITESCLIRGDMCSCCNNTAIVKDINSIFVTHPHMVKYFANIEDSYKYSYGSTEKIQFKCLDCGNIRYQNINKFIKSNLSCKQCGDGYSYPSKIAFNVLTQLDTIFESEYSPEWCNYYMNNNNKRGYYDFYIPSINKIIEIDGAFHNNDNKMNEQTKEESQYIDDEKDRLAQEHGIEVIRIDCDISDLNYIKQNILNNVKLNKLFDLSKIDWLKVEEFALKNLVKVACEYKKCNPNSTTNEIGKIMRINKTTVIRYLKQGTKLGWCNYDPKEEMRKSAISNNKSLEKMVHIYKDNNLLGVYKSAHELERVSAKEYGTSLNFSCICAVCRGVKKSYKGYTFAY